MQQSTSDNFVPSVEQTGEYYNRRPLTASAATNRPSTSERTGGLNFQVIDPIPVVTRNLPKVAPFVETEKIVARFYGYFNFDRIFELASVLGPASVGAADPRYLTFLFFVEDQTCEIIEKKQPNSGKISWSFAVYPILSIEGRIVADICVDKTLPTANPV